MKVRLSPSALADIEDALKHIATRSPQGARNVRARFQAVFDLLAQHPKIGTQTSQATIRRMTTAPYPYLIFYEPTVDEIIIHAVRHSARDPFGLPGT